MVINEVSLFRKDTSLSEKKMYSMPEAMYGITIFCGAVSFESIC